MINQQKVGAVIATAGSSRRMEGADKLFALLSDKPVIVRVIDIFQKCPAIDQIVIVLSEQNLEFGNNIASIENWTKVTDVVPGWRKAAGLRNCRSGQT